MVPKIDAKQPSKFEKHNDECCKAGFKANQQTFSPVSWQRYLISTKNKLQSAKNRRVNAVLKMANKRLACCLATVPQIDSKQPLICKNKNDECRKTGFKSSK